MLKLLSLCSRTGQGLQQLRIIPATIKVTVDTYSTTFRINHFMYDNKYILAICFGEDNLIKFILQDCITAEKGIKHHSSRWEKVTVSVYVLLNIF